MPDITDDELYLRLQGGHYILNDGGEIVPAADFLAWAEWFEHSEDQRRVAVDYVGDCWVSTVFMGKDPLSISREGRPPRLFETMVFGGADFDDQYRDTTGAAAWRRHIELTLALRNAQRLLPPHGVTP